MTGSRNPAAAPGGTVTFSDGATPLATLVLDRGRARFTTSALRPGTHRISATYTPDADDTGSSTGEPTDITVGFSRPCITDDHCGPLTVAAGESVCIASGGSQRGPLTVRPGGALSVSDARVTGPLFADGALAVSSGRCAARRTDRRRTSPRPPSSAPGPASAGDRGPVGPRPTGATATWQRGGGRETGEGGGGSGGAGGEEERRKKNVSGRERDEAGWGG
ncbi:Ig-like domain-containing protein, partial [Streptomyces sp. NPDC059957]|uniref:Ig-like domain-containing protein n=1 Tax=Streptomyces sp. NPDC059957 TaxID=3347016 RepID=UPI0036693D78